MPQAFVRKGFWALGAAFVAVLLAIAALPLIASTQIVRDRVASEISAWSGYRVEFGSAPRIDIWPTFSATVSEVKFSDWSDPGKQPVIEVEEIEVGLSALAALSGDAVISNARLLRPVVHLDRTGMLIYAPDLPAGGRIMNSVSAARKALQDNPTEPDLSTLPDDVFGTIEFVDGEVVLSDGATNRQILTGFGGAMRWPALNRPASLAATGIWRGESVALDVKLGEPLLMAAGGASALSISLKAAPLTAGFDGKASLSGSGFVDGALSVTTPSLRRTLEWWRNDNAASTAATSFALAGRAIGDVRRIKVEDAELTLGNDPGTGLLDFAIGEGKPGVSGTLAFDNLDLAAFLYTFSPLSPAEGSDPVKLEAASMGRLGFDIRLSAARASLGTIALSGVAATLQSKGDISTFDISDAQAFGGNLQTGIRYDGTAGKEAVDLRLMATDIEAGTAVPFTKATGIVPTGRATISVNLKGAGQDARSFLEVAQGTISATFGPGTLAGFNLAAFLDRIGKGGFFALSEVGGGSIDVERADIKASIGGGIARIEKAELTTRDQVTRLTGILPNLGGGLALSGAILPKGADGQPSASPLTHFFVGGSWNAPFVSPAFSPAAAGQAAAE